MSADFHDNGRDGDTQQLAATTVTQERAPTETLVASAVGDRCVNCGATLQSDQRYCVVCGERRGAPRFALPAPAVTTETTTTTMSGRAGSPGPRFGSATTLIAGVGTLLLALLVGFLIGNAASKNNTKTVNAGTPKVTVVNTGGGTSAGSATSPTSTTASSGASSSSTSHKAKPKTPKAKAKVAKQQAKAESNAAAKVTGGNGTPPANTKIGQKCSGSACNKAGYNKKTHKFDGSFFGQ
jgi:hypothetical protein